MGSWAHFDLKKGLLFRGGNVLKITKIEDIVKMGLQASKMNPSAPKIIQNFCLWTPKLAQKP